jgi:chromosome segregation ATPase
MPDIITNVRDDERRKREEAQMFNVQQQLDELRRQLREGIARQQWLEDALKQSESRTAQLQLSVDKQSQEVMQSLQVRQIEDQRLRKQIAEVEEHATEPLNSIREMRAQITELGERFRSSQSQATVSVQQMEAIQQQMREMAAQVGMLGEQQRQLTDSLHESGNAITENRQEVVRVSEAQRIEEQRLRRQDIELQQGIETVRNEFGAVVARVTQMEDTRKRFVEEIDALASSLTTVHAEYNKLEDLIERMNRDNGERYLAQQERIETVRLQLEADAADLRQVSDQRAERMSARLQQFEDRLRAAEGDLSMMPSQIEGLRQRDEFQVEQAEDLYEQYIARQLEFLDHMLKQNRKRKQRAEESQAAAEGGGLIRSAREAHPPSAEDSSDNELEIIRIAIPLYVGAGGARPWFA